MQWGPVHTASAVGFFFGISSLGYVLGWWNMSTEYRGSVYLACTLIVLVTTFSPAFSLFTEFKPSGKIWGFINGFGIGVALVLVLLAGQCHQPLIPMPSNSTTTTTTTTTTPT